MAGPILRQSTGWATDSESRITSSCQVLVVERNVEILLLRRKIALLVGLITTILVLAGGLYLYNSVSASIRATIQRSIVNKAQRALREIKSGQIALSGSSNLTISKDLSVIQIYTSNGDLLYSSQSAGSIKIINSEQLKSRSLTTVVVDRFPLQKGKNGEMFGIARGVAPDGRSVIVTVGASMDQLLDSQQDLFGVLMVVGPLAVLLASLGAWLITGRILSPVDRLRREAEMLLEDGASRRLEVPATADELAQLAMTLNHFLDKQELSVESQRLFVAAASHELRTPLAALSAEIEIALLTDADKSELRKILQRSFGRVAELAQLSSDLLLLAAGDEGVLQVDSELLLVEDLVVGVLNECLPLAKIQGISLVTDLDPGVVLYADKIKFSRVLSNLIYNALFYSDGSVITIRSYQKENKAIIEVCDDGLGFPKEFIPRAFDRFSRGAKGRPRSGGSGLGLSIAQMLVKLHGGVIEVIDISEGALVRITIPLLS